MIREIFANNVRKRRRAIKLSQQELADIIGVHRTYIGSIERNERNVSIDNIERIADGLAMPVVVLLGGTTCA